MVLRLKTISEAVEVELVVGRQVKEFRAESKDWSDLNAGIFSFTAGANPVKVRVKRGEVELDWLEGYQSAKPVRVGNAAYDQRQLDVFGELAAVIYEASRHFANHRPEAVHALMGIARYVAGVWQRV